MLRIGTTVMQVDDLGRAVAFWSAALGYVTERPLAADDDYTILVPPDAAAGAHLALDESEDVPQHFPHVHLDLYAGDARDQAAEAERLIGLGATMVADWPYPDEADFVVLADPAGNRFCIIDTSM